VPHYRFRSQYLIPVPEVLGDNPSLQEILWNFSRFKDERHRLTLRENPHFYAELPTSRKAYGNNVKIDPTEDFRHANEFYVLIGKPELLCIMTDQVSRSFGNFWCPNNAIIFKGLVVFLFCSLFLMSCQTLVGGSWGRASSRHLSQAHAVNSVSDSESSCPPFQGVIISCNPRQFQYPILLISAYAFVLGERQPIVWYVATLSHI
jgi:hypothetical protein